MFLIINEIMFLIINEIMFLIINEIEGAVIKKPWNYIGNFRVGASLNPAWGINFPAASGNLYASIEKQTRIWQKIIGLVIGKKYAVSWLQSKKFDGSSPNDIDIQIDNTMVYRETSVTMHAWQYRQSNTFVANKSSCLVYISSNQGQSAIYLDEIKLIDMSLHEKTLSVLIDANSENNLIDGDFESYTSAFPSNRGFGGQAFLSPGFSNIIPWTYNGGFQVAMSSYISKSLYWTFGAQSFTAVSASGQNFAILHMDSYISQVMRNLQVGKQYAVSWMQMYRVTSPIGFISLSVLVDNTVVFTNPNFNGTFWHKKTSLSFTANSTQHTLTIMTKNPTGSLLAAAFIDAVSLVDVASQSLELASYWTQFSDTVGLVDGGFESYSTQLANNTGYGGTAFLSPGIS
jgi:hypothetical protein